MSTSNNLWVAAPVAQYEDHLGYGEILTIQIGLGLGIVMGVLGIILVIGFGLPVFAILLVTRKFQSISTRSAGLIQGIVGLPFNHLADRSK